MTPANSSPHLRQEPEAARLFEALAVELEDGRGDPEAVFAAHPDLAGELRGLYRGWLAADALFRLAGDDCARGFRSAEANPSLWPDRLGVRACRPGRQD